MCPAKGQQYTSDRWRAQRRRWTDGRANPVARGAPAPSEVEHDIGPNQTHRDRQLHPPLIDLYHSGHVRSSSAQVDPSPSRLFTGRAKRILRPAPASNPRSSTSKAAPKRSHHRNLLGFPSHASTGRDHAPWRRDQANLHMGEASVRQGWCKPVADGSAQAEITRQIPLPTSDPSSTRWPHLAGHTTHSPCSQGYSCSL